MVIANIPEVHEEATWFLDDFLAKERVQKLVAVQARAVNVGHLGRQSWLGCIWLCSPCKQRVHAHLLLLNTSFDCIGSTHILQVNTGLPCPLWALRIFCTYNSDSVTSVSLIFLIFLLRVFHALKLESWTTIIMLFNFSLLFLYRYMYGSVSCIRLYFDYGIRMALRRGLAS